MGWKSRQAETEIEIQLWGEHAFRDLLTKYNDIKEEYFRESYFRQIREIHESIVDAAGRYGKPYDLRVDVSIQRYAVGRGGVRLHTVPEGSYGLHLVKDLLFVLSLANHGRRPCSVSEVGFHGAVDSIVHTQLIDVPDEDPDVGLDFALGLLEKKYRLGKNLNPGKKRYIVYPIGYLCKALHTNGFDHFPCEVIVTDELDKDYIGVVSADVHD